MLTLGSDRPNILADWQVHQTCCASLDERHEQARLIPTSIVFMIGGESMTVNDPLSAREREILDIVYRLEEATATEVIAAMKQPPSRSAVRTFLKILQDKGYLKHKKDGREYVYSAHVRVKVLGEKRSRMSLDTFFGAVPIECGLHRTSPSQDNSLILKNSRNLRN